MEQQDFDTGTIAALMLRFREYRLPRALRLLERVNRGELLTEEDIRFLKRVQKDGLHVQPLMKRHHEYDRLISRVMGLYTEIINKGLENEKRAGNPPPEARE